MQGGEGGGANCTAFAGWRVTGGGQAWAGELYLLQVQEDCLTIIGEQQKEQAHGSLPWLIHHILWLQFCLFFKVEMGGMGGKVLLSSSQQKESAESDLAGLNRSRASSLSPTQNNPGNQQLISTFPSLDPGGNFKETLKVK